MYVLQDKPDHEVLLLTGLKHRPVATLKDESGGVSHIIVDDGCYVLVNGNGDFGTVEHWYPEAVEALKGLPSDPREAYAELA